MLLKDSPADSMVHTDSEVSYTEAYTNDTVRKKKSWAYYARFFLLGTLMGIILTKAEIISWYRIQEMFRLQSFHMYGVIGSAIIVGIISLQLIKRLKIKSIDGETIVISPKKFHRGQIFGGLIFGFGWAMTGACPGPLFAQIGTGATVIIITLLSAIAGTWVYGAIREKLPH
jgi:uncharacterized membrane protein YedE/YeeE